MKLSAEDERNVRELFEHLTARYGVECGFTREMVEAARTLSAPSPAPKSWDEVKRLWGLVLEMTKRVEALLPPED